MPRIEVISSNLIILVRTGFYFIWISRSTRTLPTAQYSYTLHNDITAESRPASIIKKYTYIMSVYSQVMVRTQNKSKADNYTYQVRVCMRICVRILAGLDRGCLIAVRQVSISTNGILLEALRTIRTYMDHSDLFSRRCTIRNP